MTKEREYYVKIYEEALDAQGSFENAIMAVRNAPAYVDPVEELAEELYLAYRADSHADDIIGEYRTGYRERWLAVARCAMGLLERAK